MDKNHDLELINRIISLPTVNQKYDNEVISTILALTHSPNKTSRIVTYILRFIVIIQKRIEQKNQKERKSSIVTYIENIAKCWTSLDNADSTILNTNNNSDLTISLTIKETHGLYPFNKSALEVKLQPVTALDYLISATIVIHFDQIM